MSKKATKKAKTERKIKPASNRRIVLGALGGYVAHDEYTVFTCQQRDDGSLLAGIMFVVSREAVARAREESSTGAGGWGTGWRE